MPKLTVMYTHCTEEGTYPKSYSPPELVEKEGIGDDNTEENSNQVQELAEAEVHVVAGKSGAEVKEVAGDGGRVTVLKQKNPINILFFGTLV